MEIIQVTSLDGKLQDKLRQARGQQGEIHSLFERTVNILLGGELFTVAVAAIDDAPATMVLERDSLERLFLKAGEPAWIGKDSLQLGRCRIEWHQALRWDRRVPAYQPDSSSLPEHLSIARSYILQKSKAKWLRNEGSASPVGFDETLNAMLWIRTEAVFQAMRQGDTASFLSAAKQVIGLGNGLTPSGDDVLTGIVAVLMMKDAPLQIKADTKRKLLELAQEQTNLISCTTLFQAAEGRVRESLLQLLEALFSSSQEAVCSRLDTVLAIGSSSGSEIAWGILRALECCLEREQEFHAEKKDRQKGEDKTKEGNKWPLEQK